MGGKAVRFLIFLLAGTGVLAAPSVLAASEEAGHSDPAGPILLSLLLIGGAAVAGGRVAKKLGQPAVLGELVIGVILGNVGYYLHQPVITVLRDDEAMVKIVDRTLSEHKDISVAAAEVLPAGEGRDRLLAVLNSPMATPAVSIHIFVDQLSRLGVIILLFLVGLETSVREMAQVGKTAFNVAVLGVVLPMLLGLGLLWVLQPQAPFRENIFLGAILTATSVGITARVFRDLHQTHRVESKVILGAAVIDDVLGLIILAVVSGLVVTGSLSVASVTAITLKAVLFLAGAIGIGVWITPRIARRLARAETENVKLLFGLGLAFFFAWLANQFGLAPIIGAFAAGLVLEELFLQEIKGLTLHELLAPLESLVVPVFFVLMGLQVKLETFSDLRVIVLAVVLTLAAIVGKVAAGWACRKPLDKLSVGIGMMPRGEVGLIFASIGKGLGVVNDAVFSSVVIMVMLTTLLTPPLLKVTLARSDRRRATPSAA